MNDKYASSLEGVCILSYDLWALHSQFDDAVYSAAMAKAYASIVSQCTGQHPTWFKDRTDLERFLNV